MDLKMKLFVGVVILYTFYQQASSTCTFPTELVGTWENPSQGNLTFNDTHMIGYDVDAYTDLNFECHLTADDKYVVRSEDFTLLGLSNVVNAAFCISFTKESTNKYTYFIETSELADANYERVMFIQAADVISSVNEICNDSSVLNVPQETKLLIKYGEAMNEVVRCPNDILGTYWYYNHTTCTESYWDVCSTKSQMYFNYTQCSEEQAYSANGTVSCVYTVENGDDWVTYIYNEDTSVDNSAYYQYSCMIVKKDTDGLVYVTQYPQDCLKNQTSTYVLSGGQSITLSANVTCVPSSADTSVSNAGLIAGLVVLFIIILGAGGAAVGYYIYTKKFKKVDPNEKRVIDSEKSVVSTDSRTKDAVTPSVIKADVTSPRNGGSHGKRRHKRIGIKKVSGPPVPLPPVDTRSRNRRRGNFASKSLITPRDIRPISRQPSKLEDGKRNPEPVDIRNDAPKVDIAPPDLQLPLAREETFTGMSRCSTAFEDKIGFTLLPEKSNVSARSTQRASKSRQSNTSKISARQQNSKTILPKQKENKQSNSTMSTRKGISLTVQSLDKSKNNYVKHAKAVFKDRNAIYRKQIKLVGKIKKRKVRNSATSIRLDKVTKEDIDGKPKQTSVEKTTKEMPAKELDLPIIKELKRPDQPLEIKEQKRPSQPLEIKPAVVETPKLPEPVKEDTGVELKAGDGDDNFFMCSNDEDFSYAEFMENRKKEQEMIAKLENKNKYLNSSRDLPTGVPRVPKKLIQKKTSKPKTNTNAISSLLKNVESFARFSVLRQKLAVSRKSTNTKEQKEAIIEQQVLTKVFYNHNLKTTKSKVQHRRHRTRQSVDINRNLARVPTLVDWVECSDVLSMPTMKMQNRLKDKFLNYDNVKNLRYRVG